MVAKALKASDLEKSSQLERISCAVVEFSEMKKGGQSWVEGVWHGNWGTNFDEFCIPSLEAENTPIQLFDY